MPNELEIRERLELRQRFLQIIFAEIALTDFSNRTQRLCRLSLADRDETHGIGRTAIFGCRGCDARPGLRESSSKKIEVHQGSAISVRDSSRAMAPAARSAPI